MCHKESHIISTGKTLNYMKVGDLKIQPGKRSQPQALQLAGLLGHQAAGTRLPR